LLILGTQYIDYKNLSEFLDVLEPPLQIPRPNKFKIIHMDIPIVRQAGKFPPNFENMSSFLQLKVERRRIVNSPDFAGGRVPSLERPRRTWSSVQGCCGATSSI
jgi:hypothetical protein